MEFYSHESLGGDKNPNKDGDNSKSKKKKKPQLFSLPAKAETAKKVADKRSANPKGQELSASLSEQINKTKEGSIEVETSSGELAEEVVSIQPKEVAKLKSEPPFLGELIIDHSDEIEDGQASDVNKLAGFSEGESGPELLDGESAQPDSSSGEVSLEEQSSELTEPAPATPPEIELTETTDVKYSPADPLEASDFRNQEISIPSSLLPENISLGQMLNPSDWQAGKVGEGNDYGRYETESAGISGRRVRMAERRGFGRGFSSGALIGWWFGRRSATRRQEHQLSQISLSQSKARERARGATQAEFDRTLERRETAFQRAIKRLRYFIDQDKYQPTISQYSTELLQQAGPSSQTHKREQEMAPALQSMELPPVALTKLAEPLKQTEITEELSQAPAGHHFETSAWHRIEVDDKTGRPVEKPISQYGEAFQQEQQQERLAREAVNAQTAAQIATALQYSSATKVHPNALERPSEPQQALGAAPRSVVSAETIHFVKTKLAQDLSSPVTWTVAIVIFILLKITNVV